MHSIQPSRRVVRRAFTLTELLVVIAIIAMLAAIVSVAVVRALDTAKQARIKTEVDQLDSAFKAYKEKYGSYPPCNWIGLGSNAQLRQHIAQAFPRYELSDLTGDMQAAGVDFRNFRPDQALVFWLSGFSSDPKHPFVTRDGYQVADGAVVLDSNNMPVEAPRTSLFEFDISRLAEVRGPRTADPVGDLMLTPNTRIWFSYFPAGSPVGSSGAPYVYWDYRSYGIAPDMMNPPRPILQGGWNTGVMGGTDIFFADAGIASPYWNDANGNNTYDLPPIEDWINPESFQIIAAGGDGKYGARQPLGTAYRAYPTGVNYDISADLADDDNVTNFCDRARLGDAKP